MSAVSLAGENIKNFLDKFYALLILWDNHPTSHRTFILNVKARIIEEGENLIIRNMLHAFVNKFNVFIDASAAFDDDEDNNASEQITEFVTTLMQILYLWSDNEELHQNFLNNMHSIIKSNITYETLLSDLIAKLAYEFTLDTYLGLEASPPLVLPSSLKQTPGQQFFMLTLHAKDYHTEMKYTDTEEDFIPDAGHDEIPRPPSF